MPGNYKKIMRRWIDEVMEEMAENRRQKAVE
jgi:hypothetical protein